MTNDDGSDNHVFLRGRLAEVPQPKQLPSGDQLVEFRLTVTRPAKERGHVDSLECATTRPRVRRSLERAAPGDVLEVSGALRRRFWRGAGGLQSRYSVDVAELRVVSRADRTAGASRVRKPASA